MKIVDHMTKHKEGKAAASIRSCSAREKTFVANVSKLYGLKISVIGNSLIISIAISITMIRQLLFKKGK